MAHITREEAIETLYELINRGILHDDIEDKLEDIAQCIEAEIIPEYDDDIGYGLNMWGADDDIDDLFISRADPYNSNFNFSEAYKKEYDEWMEYCTKVYEKYKID